MSAAKRQQHTMHPDAQNNNFRKPNRRGTKRGRTSARTVLSGKRFPLHVSFFRFVVWKANVLLYHMLSLLSLSIRRSLFLSYKHTSRAATNTFVFLPATVEHSRVRNFRTCLCLCRRRSGNGGPCIFICSPTGCSVSPKTLQIKS
jgi:hypothetical protein